MKKVALILLAVLMICVSAMTPAIAETAKEPVTIEFFCVKEEVQSIFRRSSTISKRKTPISTLNLPTLPTAKPCS